ncbi:hypothetical protein SKAU_G00058820 [Synaphobranchus kaupii]|uniref:Uncharacterized protein n=1 Tax=Synaphobranchus kaupii TaxID=118154 RepID=A0A9Q1JAJ2_SYNKA|nr:hypothetical protein SKAU_G00058820 [Synaphobranchus kaupii]
MRTATASREKQIKRGSSGVVRIKGLKWHCCLPAGQFTCCSVPAPAPHYPPSRDDHLQRRR